MGKIFLVNAIHNYAISKAEIWQWQEHTVPLTSLVFVLVSWSQFPERCFTFERQPAREWAIKKRLKLWFSILTLYVSQGENMQDLLLWFVRWELRLYRDVHPSLHVLIYIAIHFWHTLKECLWHCWWGWMFFTQWQGLCGRKSEVDTHQQEKVFL